MRATFVDHFNRPISSAGSFFAHDSTKCLKAQAAARPPRYFSLTSNGLEFTPAGDTRFEKPPINKLFRDLLSTFGGTEAVNIQLQMRVTDVKTGELKSEIGLQSVELGIRPGNPVIPIAWEMAIRKLPSGTYRLEVQASIWEGKHALQRSVSFTVESPGL